MPIDAFKALLMERRAPVFPDRVSDFVFVLLS